MHLLDSLFIHVNINSDPNPSSHQSQKITQRNISIPRETATTILVYAESSPSAANNKGTSMKSKKRFRDDQIRSLESIFESESKLHPRKKLQLAEELGLEPRQVAIWFQNKRARSKCKQLQIDFSLLMDSYNALATRLQCLKEERRSLILQLRKLSDNLVEKQTSVGSQEQESDTGTVNGKNQESKDEQGFLVDQIGDCFAVDAIYDQSLSSNCEWLDFWSEEDPSKL